MDELNTPMVMPPEESIPDWYDGKRINEVLFCQQFLKKHPMKCVRGRLFTVDGLIEDEAQIGNLILEEISGCLTSGLSKVVANLLASIKLQAYSPPLPIETDRIHVANGTLFLDGRFTEDKSYCNNRLSVAYLPDAPPPVRWLQFLSELLVPEDIPTLQEYMGYCLLPTTKGQKMLLLIGKGGVGAFGFVRAHGFFHAAQCRLDFERLVLGYGAKNRAAENQNQIADRRHFIGEGSIGDLRASGTRYDDVAVASHFQNTHGNGDAHVLVSLLEFGKEADVALSRCLFFGGALCFVVAFVQ